MTGGGLKTLSDLGGSWCWFQRPRAVAKNGKTYLGWVAKTGEAVYAIAPQGGDPMLPYVLHDFWEPVDDHANPTFLFRQSDGRCLAFSCHHGGWEFWVRKSVNIDNGIWEPEVNIINQLGVVQFTYPRVFQLTGESGSPIWLFYRALDSGGVGEGMHFSKSVDDGDTWAHDTEVVTNGTRKPYHLLAQNGTNRIDVIFNDDNANSIAANNTYHGYIQAGNLYKSDGTLVGALNAGPYLPSVLTKVHDGAVVSSWIWDISIDLSGNPVIVFATFPSINDHHYNYARWTGSAWEEHEICAAGATICPGVGEDHYSGGISIDKNDVNIVYLSKQVSGIHEIWKYTTSDSGATWTGVAITTGSTKGNYRPVCPKDALPQSPMFYMHGDYPSYTTFETQIKAYVT